jgi:hypothetical protein
MHAFESYKSVLLMTASFYEHVFQGAINADLGVNSNAFMEASIASSVIGSCVVVKSGIEPASLYNIKKSLPI